MTQVRTIVVLILLLIACTTAKSQILNIERARVTNDTANYLTGKGGLDFSMFNRNAGKDNPNNYLQLTLTGDLAYISGKHSYLLLNYFNYLLVNYDNRELRNTVASTGYSHFRINFLRQRKLSYEFFVQAQADKARGLNLRTLEGGGIRLALLRNKGDNLYFGTGLMHEHEEWENPDVEGRIDVSNLLKSTNYFSTKIKFNLNVSTDAIVYYQFGYDNSIDRFRNRVSGDVTLNVKLTNRFSLRTNFNCIYEDEPIVPVTKFVYAISNGLQVAF
ncbi:DUF481 domain-containing protein [Pontibacter harenae]|uniref:DUF481 domain-containing protein n=1 Tax=Pontibacter harenae TaxID=2894083 RepID=UPI001E5AED7B|nr:DUF481 domain-containing protein [Pontibacter harenae]MCC9168243.1 DUF481 domain-containing protein [Pontibacter harenae]